MTEMSCWQPPAVSEGAARRPLDRWNIALALIGAALVASIAQGFIREWMG